MRGGNIFTHLAFAHCLNQMYSLVYSECHSISISDLNLAGLYHMERSKRDPENWIINRNMRLKKRHSKYNRLHVKYEVGRGVVHSGDADFDEKGGAQVRQEYRKWINMHYKYDPGRCRSAELTQ